MFNLTNNSKNKWLTLSALIASVSAFAATLNFSDAFSSNASIDTAKTTANLSVKEQALYLANSQPQHKLPDSNTAGNVFSTQAKSSSATLLVDVNQDGHIDMVVADADGDRIYYSDGTGSFNSVGELLGSNDATPTSSLIVADIDSDGNLDVITGKNNNNINKLYLSDVNNNYPIVGTNIGSETDSTVSIAYGDINGDGHKDIVTGNVNATNKLYLSDGSGGFSATGIDIGSEVEATGRIGVADLNNDGHLDVVASGRSTTNKVYLNDGNGGFPSTGTDLGSETNDSYSMALGDIDNDGDIDFVEGNVSQVNKYYLNDGTGAFSNAGTDIGNDSSRVTSFVILVDIEQDGDLDLMEVAENQANILYLNDGSGNFDNGSTIGSDTDFSTGVAAADVDHDGDVDIAIANYNQTNKIYFQAGKGDFSDTGIAISSDTNDSHNFAWGDVDNDSDLDLVVANQGLNKLYLNDGKGGFATGTNIGSETDTSEAPILVDIDGDGDLDLVVGNNNQTNKVYTNDGTGSFSATGTLIGSETDSTWAIALADLDGDGDIDFVAGNQGQTNKVYLNDGSGSFGASANIGTDTDNTFDITLVDINGDGHLDAVAGNFQQTTKVYLNDGNAVFAAGSDLNTDAGRTRRVVFADLDNDGDMDLVAGNDSAVNKLYLNDGSGNFPAAGTILGNENDDRIGLALADMDNDGDIDVVAGNYNKTNKLYLNDGSAGFSTTGIQIGSETDQTFAIALVDYDGDGDIDVLSANSNQTNKLYLNNGSTSLTNTGTAFGSDTGQSVAAAYADIDNDGDIDFVVGNESQTNQLFLNDGSGSFPTVGTDIGNEADSTNAIALADVDNDGDLDVIAGNFSQTNKLYLNDGSGGFSATGTDIGSETDTTTVIAVGDVNTDGHIDLVVGNSGAVENKLYLNDGSGGFSATGSNIGSEAESTFAIALQDINKDGLLDIVVGNENATNKRYLNDGSGGFPATGTNIGIQTDDTASLSFADIDNNGTVDMITGNYFQPNRLYFSDGNGNFPAVPTDIGGELDSTRTVIFADVDKDGDKDILVSNQSNTNKIYYNNGQGAFSAIGVDINSVADNTRAMLLVDIDKNGDLDLISLNRGLANKLYKQLSHNIHGHEVYSTKINGSVTEVVDVTLTATATINTADTRNTSIDYYVTNNGGAKWYSVKSGANFTFPETGTDDIRWRAQLNSLSPVITPELSNVELLYTALPKITNASYDILTGELTVNGINFASKTGAANDIDASMFSFTGEASGSYTLTDTADAEITSAAAFTLTLSETDKAAVNALINKNGTTSIDSTVYNLAVAEDWNAGAKSTLVIADGLTPITAGNINEAPTISGSPETSVAEDASYSFTPTFADVNTSDTKIFSITNKPSWATFSTTTGALTGTPTNDDVGTTSGIVIMVTDKSGLSASLAAFNLAVANTNDAPTIAGIPATTAVQGVGYSFIPTVDDVDVGDTQTFSITNKPSWATFSTTTGALSGTPGNGDIGTTNGIVITVTDSGLVSQSLAAFDISVANTNDAPVITGTPATTVAQGVSYSFIPTATDIDAGDTQTFSITNKPDWAAFSTTTGALTGTPVNDDVGTTSDIVITVTDSAGATASLAAFDLVVTNPNTAPVITGTPKITIAQGESYSFIPTATDIDAGDTQTFSITNKPDWAAFSTTTGALTGTPTSNDVGTTSDIVITVTDSTGATASLAAFNIEVTNTDISNLNVSVVATSLSDTSFEMSYEITLTNNGTNSVSNVQITTTIPTGIEVQTLPDNCVLTGTQLTCTVVSIGSGESTSISLILLGSEGFEGEVVTNIVGENSGTGGQVNNVSTSFDSVFKEVTVEAKSNGGSMSIMSLFGSLLLLLVRRVKLKVSTMKKLTALVFVFFASSSQASDWSIDLNLGRADSEVSNKNVEQGLTNNSQAQYGISTDGKRVAYQVELGYQLNDDWRVLVGYMDLGEANMSFEGVASSVNKLVDAVSELDMVTGEGFTSSAEYKYRLSDWFVAPQVGLFSWRGQLDIEISDELYTFKENDLALIYGLTLGYQLDDIASLGLRWQQTKIERDVNTIMFTFSTQF